MTAFWYWLLGIDSGSNAQAVNAWSLEFPLVPQGPWAVAAAVGLGAALGAVVWLYRKQAPHLARWKGLALAGIRWIAIGALLFMLAGTTLVLRQTDPVIARVPILIDTSQSMGLVDPVENDSAAEALAQVLQIPSEPGQSPQEAIRKATRLELAMAAMRKLQTGLQSASVPVPFRFDQQLQELDAATWLTGPVAAGGAQTAVGDALQEVLNRHKERDLSAVILITDGNSNRGLDPVAAARLAKERQVPLVLLAVGSADTRHNLRIAALNHAPVVFTEDTVPVEILVESAKPSETATDVVLEQRQEGGDWAEVGKESLSWNSPGIKRAIFRPKFTEPGSYELRTRVSALGTETSVDDNERQDALRVVRQRIRVLLLAGYPVPEYQFLVNALSRDPGILLSGWLQTSDPEFVQAGRHPLRRPPSTEEELEQFDVVLLIDPDPALLPPNWADLLEHFVGQVGGGLIFVAGELNSPTLLAGESTGGLPPSPVWKKLVPVVRETGLFRTEAELALSGQESYRFELTTEGREHPIFQFVPGSEENNRVLDSLPGLNWHFPVTRAKRGATVYAQHGDVRMTNEHGRHVLMASQWYGPGQCLFIGFDSTYRWRYLHEDYFDGFWARIVDEVGRSKALGLVHPLKLTTDKPVYHAGERALLYVGAASESAGLPGLEELSLELEPPSGRTIPLKLERAPDRATELVAELPLDKPGNYTVRVGVIEQLAMDSGPRPASITIVVEPPQEELERTALNTALLQEMAAQSGGHLYTLAECQQILRHLPKTPRLKSVEFRDEIWDAPLGYGTLVMSLILEWILRKRARLA